MDEVVAAQLKQIILELEEALHQKMFELNLLKIQVQIQMILSLNLNKALIQALLIIYFGTF